VGIVAALGVVASAALVAEPVRLAGRAFGYPAEIEVRDLPAERATGAIEAAFAELEAARFEAAQLAESARSGLPVPLTAEQFALLERALAVCAWSEGTLSPAGGELLALWGFGEPVASLPAPEALERAVASAGCDRTRLTATTVQLVAGSTLELAPFALGWGVDRAANRLAEAGATDFWIAAGPIARAAGGGPGGRGWPVEPPRFAGQSEPLEGFQLRDRALAVLTPGERPLRVAGDRYAPFVDFRRGRPASGLVGLLVSTELAVDAAAVGWIMFARGSREGTMLLGTLPERPSIRWLLGTGEGPPVLTDVHWGALARR
jgi:thiamine biosynthesis lipoprotein